MQKISFKGIPIIKLFDHLAKSSAERKE